MAKSRTLEFTILSAEDLRIDGRSVKKNAFALVKTDLFNSKSTAADFDGGSYPRWNEKLVVDLPERTQSVTVEVQCKVGAGNRVVGTASVPVSDFLGDVTPVGYLHFLSYRLRDPRGLKNGIVNFSVRVIGGGGGGGCSTPSWKTTSSSSSWGVPAARDGDACSGGGVVTGVPVWGMHKN
ncbi:BON1-associated protein 2 [Linum grandiflorum]